MLKDKYDIKQILWNKCFLHKLVDGRYIRLYPSFLCVYCVDYVIFDQQSQFLFFANDPRQDEPYIF